MFTTAFLDLPPLEEAAGTVVLPGSKSISNRVLLLAALSGGTTRVHDLLDSDDTRVMLEALRALGCGVVSEAGVVTISGLRRLGSRSDPKLWRDVLLANRHELVEQAKMFSRSLHNMLEHAEQGNGEKLEEMIALASRNRGAWRMGNK